MMPSTGTWGLHAEQQGNGKRLQRRCRQCRQVLRPAICNASACILCDPNLAVGRPCLPSLWWQQLLPTSECLPDFCTVQSQFL